MTLEPLSNLQSKFINNISAQLIVFLFIKEKLDLFHSEFSLVENQNTTFFETLVMSL